MKTKTVEATPGPWYVVDKPSHHEIQDEMYTIGEVYTSKADAKIIAAAPDMLLALEYVKSYFEGNIISFDSKRIEAAIKKATE